MINKINKILNNLLEQKRYYVNSLFPKIGQSLPLLRFKGFTDKWKLVNVDLLTSYIQPNDYIPNIDVYSDQKDEIYKYPVLTAGKTFVLGYVNEQNNKKLFTDVPCIIFDDFTTDVKYVNFPFYLRSSAAKIIKSKNNFSIYLLSFILENLRMDKLNNKEHGRHWISVTSQKEILIPSTFEEQQAIANFLSKLDGLIERERAMLENLTKYQKQYYLDYLFPRENQVLPIMRFSGFDDMWIKKLSSELMKIVDGLTYSNSNLSNNDDTNAISVLRANNVENNSINFDDLVYVKSNIKYEKSLLHKNDILMCTNSGSKKLVGKLAIFQEETNNVVAGGFMKIIRDYINLLPYLFQTEKFKIQLEIAIGSTVTIASLSKKQLLNFNFLIPQNQIEQQKIATFLQTLDN